MSFKSKKVDLLCFVLTIFIFAIVSRKPRIQIFPISKLKRKIKRRFVFPKRNITRLNPQLRRIKTEIFTLFSSNITPTNQPIFICKNLTAEAKPSGEKIHINPEKGNAKAWFGDPPTIKIGDDDSIYIGWTAKGRVKGKIAATTVLNLSVSRDGGKSFDAPVKVNDDSAPASHGMHSLEISLDGKVFMAWLDERQYQSRRSRTPNDCEMK